MVEHKLTLEEKVRVKDNVRGVYSSQFWGGLFVGFMGGLISNIWAWEFYRWLDSPYDVARFVGAGVATVVLLALAFLIWKQTKIKYKVKK